MVGQEVSPIVVLVIQTTSDLRTMPYKNKHTAHIVVYSNWSLTYGVWQEIIRVLSSFLTREV